MHEGNDLSQMLLDLLCCPQCHSGLERTSDSLRCGKCGVNYPVQDGIPNLVRPESLTSDKDRLRTEWDGVAEQYEPNTWNTKRPEDFKRTDEPLVEASTGVTLEVGCATGRLLRSLRNGRAETIVGLDFARRMLEITRSQGFQVVQGDAEHLPFHDESLDTVVSGWATFRFLDTERMFNECARVLKPGGRLAFTLWNGRSHSQRLQFFRSITDDPPNPREGRIDVINIKPVIRNMERAGFRLEKLGGVQANLRKLFGEGGLWLPGVWATRLFRDIVVVGRKNNGQVVS